MDVLKVGNGNGRAVSEGLSGGISSISIVSES